MSKPVSLDLFIRNHIGSPETTRRPSWVLSVVQEVRTHARVCTARITKVQSSTAQVVHIKQTPGALADGECQYPITPGRRSSAQARWLYGVISSLSLILVSALNVWRQGRTFVVAGVDQVQGRLVLYLILAWSALDHRTKVCIWYGTARRCLYLPDQSCCFSRIIA